MSSEELLSKYLQKVARIFNVDAILDSDIDAAHIIKYYEQSEPGYRLFHSTEGSIHMALNYDGRFDKAGYYEQARIVSQHINELTAKDVLEIASGKGFNSIFLAQRHNEVEFSGVDLTPAHVKLAQRKSLKFNNLEFSLGDFQDLKFAPQSFDIVFEVESICHATDMRAALLEAYRVLKPGGRFIVIDGFRKPGFENLDSKMKTAAKLVEVSMAVGHPWMIDSWLDLADEVGFTVRKVEDLSYAIMPNLKKFQLLARGYFKYPSIGKYILRISNPNLVKNAIAGLLMPITLEANVQGYYKIILERST
jgi:ubiquinone/menaquinone biosynthesis C-methylase UbiE